jgi:hypothetical protein
MASTPTTHRPGPAASFHKRPLCRDKGNDPRSAELAASMIEHQRQVSHHHHAMLQCIAEFDATQAWRGDGALSMASWLTQHCGISPVQSRILVATAERMGSLPRLADALSEGAITLDVLHPVAKVATPDTDAELAEAAPDWSVKQANDLARDARGAPKPQGEADHRHRFLRFNDERCSLVAQLTKDKYALVKSALLGRAVLHNHPSASDPDVEPLECRLADALAEVCIERGRKSSPHPGGPSSPSPSPSPSSPSAHCDGDVPCEDAFPEDVSAGDDGPLFSGAPATVVVHVDLLRFMVEDDACATIEGLGPVSIDVVRRLCCDAKVSLSVEGPDGNFLDLHPLRRSPTTAQRIEIGRRDCGCRWGACGYRNVTDVHHMWEFGKGGPTVLSNLITLCAAHHSRVHELGWKMEGDANGVVSFTSPHGRTFTSRPSPSWRRSLPQRE